jgi:uncharacterized UPF0160 family protein
VATYAATIDSGRVSVDIGVEYDEEANVFDLIRFKATRRVTACMWRRW